MYTFKKDEFIFKSKSTNEPFNNLYKDINDAKNIYEKIDPTTSKKFFTIVNSIYNDIYIFDTSQIFYNLNILKYKTKFTQGTSPEIIFYITVPLNCEGHTYSCYISYDNPIIIGYCNRDDIERYGHVLLCSPNVDLAIKTLASLFNPITYSSIST